MSQSTTVLIARSLPCRSACLPCSTSCFAAPLPVVLLLLLMLLLLLVATSRLTLLTLAAEPAAAVALEQQLSPPASGVQPLTSCFSCHAETMLPFVMD
jgi:hypothetical protein